jgi:hypothetical protein
MPDTPTDTLPQANPDEVLSQLAGQEVDRLLEAAEARPAPALTQAEEPEVTAQLNELFAKLNSAEQVVADRPAPVEAERPAQPATAEPAAPDPVETAAATVESASPGVAASLEQQVLSAAALASIPESPPATAAEPVTRPVRRRDWLGAALWPLARASACLSPTTLDWMGKAAVLTTINALLILVYVLLVRR